MSLNTAIHFVESLVTFIESLRDRFDDFEMMAIEICGNSSYKNVKRNGKGKRFYDEMEISDSEDIDLSPNEYFKTNTFVRIIDNLNSAIRFRLEAYKLPGERFGFLSRLTELLIRNYVKLHLILSIIAQMI